jgi:DNA-binding response OmpR family regulator
MNILIVENDINTRYLLELLVHTAGHTAILTTHADQAVEAFKQFAVDLVILDLELPGRDGFYLLGQLRRRSDLPIIAMTGDVEDVGAQALERGANEIMPKPFSSLEFQAVIREQLRRYANAKLKAI